MQASPAVTATGQLDAAATTARRRPGLGSGEPRDRPHGPTAGGCHRRWQATVPPSLPASASAAAAHPLPRNQPLRLPGSRGRRRLSLAELGSLARTPGTRLAGPITVTASGTASYGACGGGARRVHCYFLLGGAKAYFIEYNSPIDLESLIDVKSLSMQSYI